MPEDPEDQDDDEFTTVFSVQFSDDDNVFATLDFLGWNWTIVPDGETSACSYGIPDYLMN